MKVGIFFINTQLLQYTSRLFGYILNSQYSAKKFKKQNV
ncbi:hypothetical protein D1AOALGA4SA_2409 [Olavius algarvensis Delta 1 endosymbiont]|nr:hypothetical protein D1AOALGA4SA_2409 [Olavius algarvensis Delta 1 endosymbiont]